MTMKESIILSFFDLTFYIIISKKLLCKTIIKKHLIIITFFSVLIGIESYLFNNWFSTIFSGILIVMMIYLIYKKKILDIIYIYLLSTILILCIQFLSLLPLYVIFNKILYDFKIGMVAQIINLVVILVITKFIPIHHLYSFVITRKKALKYIIINTFLLLFSLVIYWKIDINNIIENLISVLILSIFIVSINLIVIKDSFNTEKLLNEIKINKKYSPIIDELIADIQTRQHDFNNHIQALRMVILTSNTKEEIISSFNKYTEQISFKNDLNNLLEINNKIVASFLYWKKAYSEEKDIRFTIHINKFNLSSIIYDYEWIEIFGILIDNALETNVKNNVINVIIDEEENMNLIIVKNKHPYLKRDVMKNMFNKGISTKSDSNRGYGLFNLKKLVNKYHGRIEVFNESSTENYVVFKVLLP